MGTMHLKLSSELPIDKFVLGATIWKAVLLSLIVSVCTGHGFSRIVYSTHMTPRCMARYKATRRYTCSSLSCMAGAATRNRNLPWSDTHSGWGYILWSWVRYWQGTSCPPDYQLLMIYYKVVVQAALSSKFRRAVGIELLTSRCLYRTRYAWYVYLSVADDLVAGIIMVKEHWIEHAAYSGIQEDARNSTIAAMCNSWIDWLPKPMPRRLHLSCAWVTSRSLLTQMHLISSVHLPLGPKIWCHVFAGILWIIAHTPRHLRLFKNLRISSSKSWAQQLNSTSVWWWQCRGKTMLLSTSTQSTATIDLIVHDFIRYDNDGGGGGGGDDDDIKMTDLCHGWHTNKLRNSY